MFSKSFEKPLATFGILLSIALLVAASGCTSADTTGKAAKQERIKVSGAFALYPMIIKWSEEYGKLHPEVKIDVSAGGAGKGMTDVISGMVDLGMISREIYKEETDRGVVFVPVTRDAVVPTINSANPVIATLLEKGVTKEGFKGIWMTGDVKTWGQLAGTGSVEKINTFSRSDSCGAAETWAKYLGGKQEDLLGVQVYGDPGIADAVKNEKDGIGYNNLNYAFDAKTGKQLDGIKVLPIDINGNGVLDSGEKFYDSQGELIKAIADGSYPSPPARDLYLVAKGSFSGAAAEFVKWILTDGQKYVLETGYINLPDEKIQGALQKVQ